MVHIMCFRVTITVRQHRQGASHLHARRKLWWWTVGWMCTFGGFVSIAKQCVKLEMPVRDSQVLRSRIEARGVTPDGLSPA